MPSNKPVASASDPERDKHWLIPLVRKVAPKVEDVERWVAKIRKARPKASNLDLAAAIGHKIAVLYAGQGALTALPGAIPGLGTAVQVGIEVGAITADLSFMLRNQSYMCLAMAHVYGHDLRSSDREYELLLALGLWCGAIRPIGEAVVRVSSKIAAAAFKKHVPGKLFASINRKVGTTIVTKYGTKRGGIAVGRAIPFLVGSVVGAGFNLVTMIGFKASCIAFYDDILPNNRSVDYS
jgi:hypothetical protein